MISRVSPVQWRLGGRHQLERRGYDSASSFTETEHMNRRSLGCNWTEEDRRTCARWRRAMAIFYGCTALLVLGVIALTTARPDETSDLLYPGRYAANCKPAPIVGCVCKIDPTGPMRQLFQAASESNDGPSGDIEYLRMMEWLRATCTAVTRPTGFR
jgi:hypothetical protein